MPGSEDPDHASQSTWLDEFESIEILKNLLELRAKLREEHHGIETQMD